MKRRCYPLRAKLDLTQQELAHFVQLPLSTVAMCERGKRTWPTKGLLRLGLLEFAWLAAENSPVDEAPVVAELLEAVGKLKSRMKECLQTAGRLQKMLDSMKTLFPLLKTKEKTLELLSEPGTSSIHQGWIEIQQYYILKPLAENSPAKQILLEHQINTLQAEAAAAAATIETLEQQMEVERLDAAGEKHLQRPQKMEEERPDASGEKYLERRHIAMDEGAETALSHEAVETTESILLATNETQPLQTLDTVISSGVKKFYTAPSVSRCGQIIWANKSYVNRFDASGEKSRIRSEPLRPKRGSLASRHANLKKQEIVVFSARKSFLPLQVFQDAHKLSGRITVTSSDSMLQVKNTCSGVIRKRGWPRDV